MVYRKRGAVVDVPGRHAEREIRLFDGKLAPSAAASGWDV